MNTDGRSGQAYPEDFFDVACCIFPMRNARESHYNLLHDTPSVHVPL